MRSFSVRHKLHVLRPLWNAFARFRIDHFISYSCCLSFNSHMCFERAVIVGVFFVLERGLVIAVAGFKLILRHADVYVFLSVCLGFVVTVA